MFGREVFLWGSCGVAYFTKSVQIQSAKRFSDIGIEVSLHDGVGVLVVCGIQETGFIIADFLCAPNFLIVL